MWAHATHVLRFYLSMWDISFKILKVYQEWPH